MPQSPPTNQHNQYTTHAQSPPTTLNGFAVPTVSHRYAQEPSLYNPSTWQYPYPGPMLHPYVPPSPFSLDPASSTRSSGSYEQNSLNQHIRVFDALSQNPLKETPDLLNDSMGSTKKNNSEKTVIKKKAWTSLEIALMNREAQNLLDLPIEERKKQFSILFPRHNFNSCKSRLHRLATKKKLITPKIRSQFKQQPSNSEAKHIDSEDEYASSECLPSQKREQHQWTDEECGFPS